MNTKVNLAFPFRLKGLAVFAILLVIGTALWPVVGVPIWAWPVIWPVAWFVIAPLMGVFVERWSN
ncbi:Uncharacterised protein [Mycobacteroides abscessus subsp. abscessus]|nr:hypothetical protein PROPHIGD102-1_65 [Mycobacterium phage prophiGD102-1]SHW29677.1 Uncharacterised protein [Mycobacteroides abscessus subsp. abscessus]SHX88812.1 Uncharacterised protein [Mycobacteroides abscessus subsp. abscessus]SHZ26811.1 Uncharacterised protein [Mycobacteroides abscessus subsp. abscessus]SID24131.1 Uncharacterised protein [Mycobacteroides abscessus subsp. abscessus]